MNVRLQLAAQALQTAQFTVLETTPKRLSKELGHDFEFEKDFIPIVVKKCFEIADALMREANGHSEIHQ